jgi:hypothetical protein
MTKNDRHQWRCNISEEKPCILVVTTKRNEYILEALKVDPADEKLRRYKSNWLRHAAE